MVSSSNDVPTARDDRLGGSIVLRMTKWWETTARVDRLGGSIVLRMTKWWEPTARDDVFCDDILKGFCCYGYN